MATPTSIVRSACKDVGALGLGQSLAGEQLQDGFALLNEMLAQWNRKRWMVFHLVTVGVTSTGAQHYTIGPPSAAGVAADIPQAVRPDALEYAFVRQLNSSNSIPIDYPLRILHAMQDYAAISAKTLGNYPRYLFYDPKFPQGEIFPWPIPQSGIYGVFVVIKGILSGFTSISQTIDLPPEYDAALHYNLALRLGPLFRKPVSDEVKLLAKDGRNVIRQANAAVPTLRLPGGLLQNGWYQGFSDRVL